VPRRGKVKTALRERIRQLLREGETQTSIALKLDKAVSTIAYHVRKLGIAPKKYFRALPLQGGKRRCASCRKRKTPEAFPSGSHPICTTCIRKN
jgi:hypothetical protein